MTKTLDLYTNNIKGGIMNKYWWIIRTDVKCALPYDKYVVWYNIPKFIYWLIKYRNIDYWFSLTHVRSGWYEALEVNYSYENDVFLIDRTGNG